MVKEVEEVMISEEEDIDRSQRHNGEGASLSKLLSFKFLRNHSSLLHKSGYRAVSVPDGLKACELLKGKPQSIDLVLSEVELPFISGFSLLSLIMEDGTCRNIHITSLELILKRGFARGTS